MTSLSTAPSGSQLQLAFTYDYMGRRIQKLVSTNNGTYVGEYTNKYAYDAWNCLAILNPSLILSNTFLWGSDLSGSLQGAGGVGGLIKVAYYGATTTNCFVAYDGNGNVSALVNAANGVTVANYDYGPFGELIRLSGPMAKLNPLRFSTKYDDDETDFLYYGYRYYNPSTGRWLSRDPIEEKGFQVYSRSRSRRSGLEPNLYVFVKNSPLNYSDALGLKCRIALECSTVARSGVPLGTHCGIVIDSDNGVFDMNGSGGGVNTRNLTSGLLSDATGPWTDEPDSVCDCIFANITPWNNMNVPRDHLCANSNWNLHCLVSKCNISINWGSQNQPIGYNCKVCKQWQTMPLGISSVPCCQVWGPKPCPDQ
jgi:RHS repeat-associated protein